MSLFLKNYMPKASIHQTHAGKWVASCGNDTFDKSFVQFEDGRYYLSILGEPTRFETIDDIVMALYEYAYNDHIEDIKNQITYSKVKVKL